LPDFRFTVTCAQEFVAKWQDRDETESSLPDFRFTVSCAQEFVAKW